MLRGRVRKSLKSAPTTRGTFAGCDREVMGRSHGPDGNGSYQASTRIRTPPRFETDRLRECTPQDRHLPMCLHTAGDSAPMRMAEYWVVRFDQGLHPWEGLRGHIQRSSRASNRDQHLSHREARYQVKLARRRRHARPSFGCGLRLRSGPCRARLPIAASLSSMCRRPSRTSRTTWTSRTGPRLKPEFRLCPISSEFFHRPANGAYIPDPQCARDTQVLFDGQLSRMILTHAYAQ
jgi:hypothetical protein